MRFDYTIVHIPGKLLYTADTLSHAPVRYTANTQTLQDMETEHLVRTIVSQLPATKDHLEEYWKAQHGDTICSQLITFCKQGWPNTRSKETF